MAHDYEALAKRDWRYWIDKAVSATLWAALSAVFFYGSGYKAGLQRGQRWGVDVVMCTMDRLTNARPVGGIGPSDFCRRIDRERNRP